MPVLTRRRTGSAIAALALGLTLGACSSSGTGTSGTPAVVPVDGGKHLDVSGFATLAASPSTVLIDVRTRDEFTAGHLRGARNIDFRAADFDARLAALDKAATYAVYCHSGNRSGQALQRMATVGFTQVADLSGGVTAWISAGRPVTTS